MYISEKGMSLIKSFESCVLTAYQPKGEDHKKYPLYTIGWGHYGVKAGIKWTQKQADEQFKKDMGKYCKIVDNAKKGFVPNQGQYDALVSFCYNGGKGMLEMLLANGTRDASIVGNKMLQYTKSGGKELRGLVIRRQAEHALFVGKGSTNSNIKPKEKANSKLVKGNKIIPTTDVNIRSKANTSCCKIGILKKGHKCTIQEVDGSWIKICVIINSKTVTGWIYSNYVMKVD